MIHVRPALVTADPAEWQRFAELLGVQATGADAGTETGTGSTVRRTGAVMIREAQQGDLAGSIELRFAVDDLASTEAAVRAAGLNVATIDAAEDPGLVIQTESGVRVIVSGGRLDELRTGAEAVPYGALTVMPIWYQDDLAEPRRVIEALGLRERVASDSRTWTDFTADGGGLIALHRSSEDPRLELSFETAGDLDDLASLLVEAACTATVIDEAYNRTLRVVTPDSVELSINGVIDDLYGYRRIR